MKRIWTEEILQSEALKYNKRSEFRKFSSKAYAAAYDHKLLDKICDHMVKRNSGPNKKLARNGLKFCSGCNITFPVNNFYKKKKAEDGFSLWCKDCDRKSQIKSKFGLLPEEYDKMFKVQNGLCAICEKPEIALSRWGTLRVLSVDHCHKTNKIRGLLCHSCNLVIGKFSDDPQRFKKAAIYLEKT